MSSGAECNFTEREPGKWFYRIQQWPYGDWEEYETNGPFTTYRQATDHLDSNYQNPGGWSVDRHPNHVHNGKLIDGYDNEKVWTCCDEAESPAGQDEYVPPSERRTLTDLERELLA